MRITPIIHDGQRYQSRDSITLWTPWLGDHTLSRSSGVIASRVSGVDAQGHPRQQGYRFHLIKRQLTPEGSVVTLEEAANFCHDGNKGDFSFDERFLTIHHYVDEDDWQELGYTSAEDQQFQQLKSKGSSNIYVVDLLTGSKQRVTQMPAGQFAMFPHFRSDGWIYFMVWDRNQQRRYVVATDAILRRMP